MQVFHQLNLSLIQLIEVFHFSYIENPNQYSCFTLSFPPRKKTISYYEQALSIDQEVYGERHPNVAIDLNNIGSAWQALGDSKKAISYYEQALSIDTEVYGERHPNVATYLSNIGLAWEALGDSRRAKGYFQQAYDMFREFYGNEHPHTKATKDWLDSLR